MFRNVNPRCFAALLMLSCSSFSARAAEVSAAERVETTPGLSPNAVRRVFDAQRQALTVCPRLTAEVPQKEGPTRSAPWTAPADADDRVLFRFVIDANGTVAKLSSVESTMKVRGAFIDPGCAQELARQWTFPPVDGESSVEVSVWARFRTTEAERKASLARFKESAVVLCQAMSAAIPGDAVPSREVWEAAIARILSERGPSLDTRLHDVIDAVRRVNPMDASAIMVSAMEGLTANVECPKLRAWAGH
ncbi:MULTISPECIES: hypothetical protein [Corallococcus]|uniref:hypothetical protein n=1 Tax=Corallococcus TaxID=83461 RepID=UPI00117D921B|nr:MULTISPECIES: hypothetical protein [Corallococcus]NBD11432.1 hypothetical protein [Corallococcus silvisoli]TSC32367.1 hypothetical protein FOF48_10015 [Corallococcus sp. Z5C101001]